VIQAAEELGYVPDAAARALASRRTQIVGLLLARSPHHLASDAFIIQILDGLIHVVRENGMRLMTDIVEPHHQEGAYLELVRAKRIDGIILSGPRFDDEALHALEKDGFPTVIMGQLPETSLYSVDIDNYAAARTAVAHLINLGHHRIACITNASMNYTAAAERLRGYRGALETAGLQYAEELVCFGDFDPQSGYEQMKSLLDLKPDPTAVFVASDVVAFGAMAAIKEHGLAIPGDIALVGFDDVPFARFVDPPLTTVNLPATDLARRSCEVLFQLIRREQPKERHILLDAHLVVRQSCGMNNSSNIVDHFA
jgi:LacI family transcriptional regulator